jgi:hypothetical protein
VGVIERLKRWVKWVPCWDRVPPECPAFVESRVTLPHGAVLRVRAAMECGDVEVAILRPDEPPLVVWGGCIDVES